VAHPRSAYILSFASASLCYVVALAVQIGPGGAGGHDVVFALEFAVVFWLVNGMAATLLLLMLPWYAAVRFPALVRTQSPPVRLLAFAIAGAITTFVLGCATSALSPKPLFVDDQTFVQACLIAAERQGWCFLLAGAVFGVTLWFVSDRPRHRV
jgi:hypothetical protein